MGRKRRIKAENKRNPNLFSAMLDTLSRCERCQEREAVTDQDGGEQLCVLCLLGQSVGA